MPTGNNVAYPARQKQSGAVGSSIVGEAHLHAIVKQLMGIRRTQHFVTFNLGINNLDNEREGKKKTVTDTISMLNTRGSVLLYREVGSQTYSEYYHH